MTRNTVPRYAYNSKMKLSDTIYNGYLYTSIVTGYLFGAIPSPLPPGARRVPGAPWAVAVA